MKECFDGLKEDFHAGNFSTDVTQRRNTFCCRAYNRATTLCKYAGFSDKAMRAFRSKQSEKASKLLDRLIEGTA